jgi:hypothetical protein
MAEAREGTVAFSSHSLRCGTSFAFAAGSSAEGSESAIMHFDAKAVDTEGDGQITKEEFMKYGEARFDGMKKNSKGMISVSDAAKNFGRGNQHRLITSG